MKILFLDGYSKFYMEGRAKNSMVENKTIYKSSGIMNKVIRGIGLKFYLPIMYLAYGDWKKNIDRYDMFVVSSRLSSKYAIKYIKEKTGKRVVVWYWNQVSNGELDPEYCKKMGCEPWTFDKNDAEKYKMFWNNTYFFENNSEDVTEIENDIYYIGIDREGRIEKLNSLKFLSDLGYKLEFKVMRSPIKKKEKNFCYSKRIEYTEVIEQVKKTRVILELTKSTQSGITLRTLESIFLKKKLITDNQYMKEYDLYDPNNIFILGEDKLEDLPKFINGEYKDIDETIKKKYTFDSWLERLINKKEYQ